MQDSTFMAKKDELTIGCTCLEKYLMNVRKKGFILCCVLSGGDLQLERPNGVYRGRVK